MSEGPKGDTPIIIVKKKGGHGGHHGGAWKVAYADFVTAMMALFIVLWILAQGNEVRESVANYFKDPIGFAKGKGMAPMEGNDRFVADPKLLEENRKKEEMQKEREKLKEMGEQIAENLKEMPEFREIMENIQIQSTEEGLRVELLEKSNDVFFEIGTSRLNNKAMRLLEIIGSQFATLKNRVVIEGHTDARPFQNGNNGYTNYELSADRANAARRALQNGGLHDEQIDEIRGYADKRLKNPNDPFDLVNRRISIVVKYPGAK